MPHKKPPGMGRSSPAVKDEPHGEVTNIIAIENAMQVSPVIKAEADSDLVAMSDIKPSTGNKASACLKPDTKVAGTTGPIHEMRSVQSTAITKKSTPSAGDSSQPDVMAGRLTGVYYYRRLARLHDLLVDSHKRSPNGTRGTMPDVRRRYHQWMERFHARQLNGWNGWRRSGPTDLSPAAVLASALSKWKRGESVGMTKREIIDIAAGLLSPAAAIGSGLDKPKRAKLPETKNHEIIELANGMKKAVRKKTTTVPTPTRSELKGTSAKYLEDHRNKKSRSGRSHRKKRPKDKTWNDLFCVDKKNGLLSIR
ncbi:hypothetical protein QBC45DRAFT_389920 [Copromyces sp. CBS 386.78]|nr:hypothetical protein QBC45DRAFT_389920 [Copromyces sp. CBS 386.78]